MKFQKVKKYFSALGRYTITGNMRPINMYTLELNNV